MWFMRDEVLEVIGYDVGILEGVWSKDNLIGILLGMQLTTF